MEQIDVVIIGSGPAGLSTALHLQRLSPRWKKRCVVLEKERHPRHKLCAGGITTFGLLQLKELGLRIEIPHVPVRMATFRYGSLGVRVHGDPAFVVTRRSEFDAQLAEAARRAGLDLREGEAAEALERDGDAILVHTRTGTLHARAIVGADGSLGLTRRWAFGRARPARVARLLETVTPASGDEPEYLRGVARFDFTPTREGLQGYAWDFPSLVDSHPFMNRGVYDARVSTSRAMAPLPRLLESRLERNGAPAAGARPEGHPIHWYSPRGAISAPGVLLTGDAAGADPLLGEGIALALAYGSVAAEELQAGFARGDLSFRGYRRRVLLSPLGRYLALRWMTANVAYRLCGQEPFMYALWAFAGLLARFYAPAAVPEALPRVP